MGCAAKAPLPSAAVPVGRTSTAPGAAGGPRDGTPAVTYSLPLRGAAQKEVERGQGWWGAAVPQRQQPPPAQRWATTLHPIHQTMSQCCADSKTLQQA